MDIEWFLIGLASGLLLGAVLAAAYAAAKAGSFGRARWGMAVAGRASRDPELSAKLDALLGTARLPTTAPANVPAPPSGEPLRLLAILQSEARLIDFLMEKLDAAPPDAVKAGVMEVQRKAVAALGKHVVLESILAGAEGDRVSVPKGFDPVAISVLGQVTGEPPFSGELQHPGWKVKELKLPKAGEGRDLFVLQPAEVMM